MVKLVFQINKQTAEVTEKSLRYINKSKYHAHSEPLFKENNKLKLRDQYKVQCCKLYYNCKIGVLDNYHSRQLIALENRNEHNTKK